MTPALCWALRPLLRRARRSSPDAPSELPLSMADILDFSRRAQLNEEMDGPCSYEELRRCLAHLAVVNRLTLAHRHTLRWLERTVESVKPSRHAPQSALRLLDIGCGYGDMLRKIERWAA